MSGLHLINATPALNQQGFEDGPSPVTLHAQGSH